MKSIYESCPARHHVPEVGLALQDGIQRDYAGEEEQKGAQHEANVVEHVCLPKLHHFVLEQVASLGSNPVVPSIPEKKRN